MRTLRRGTALVATLLLTLLASGCGTITNSAIGTWAAEQPEVHLEFTHEGVVSGTDGCNRVTGYWQQDGDTVTFYGLASTLKGCPDTQVWLVNPATATVEAGTMTFYNAEHDKLGQLRRQ